MSSLCSACGVNLCVLTACLSLLPRQNKVEHPSVIAGVVAKVRGIVFCCVLSVCGGGACMQLHNYVFTSQTVCVCVGECMGVCVRVHACASVWVCVCICLHRYKFTNTQIAVRVHMLFLGGSEHHVLVANGNLPHSLRLPGCTRLSHGSGAEVP